MLKPRELLLLPVLCTTTACARLANQYDPHDPKDFASDWITRSEYELFGCSAISLCAIHSIPRSLISFFLSSSFFSRTVFTADNNL